MEKTVILFVFLSIIAKVVAFGKELAVSYSFGASMTSDVFLLSITLPVTIFGFISTGIISGFIPSYQRIQNKKSDRDAKLFSNRVINLLLIVCFAMVLSYYLWADWLLRLFASGFSDDAMDLAKRFTNISIWAIPLSALVTIFTAYLQINNKILITALVSIPLNVGVIISAIAASVTGTVMILPIGFLLSTFIQVIFLLFFVKMTGYHYQLTFGLGDENVKLFFGNLGLLVISSSIQQINVLVDRTLATQITVGGLSMFEYGNRINDFVMGMTIVPIATTLFPSMARSITDTKILIQKMEDGMKIFAVVMIPLTMIVVFFSNSIVKILYQRGAFDSAAVDNTAQIVKYYGIGLFAFAVRDLLLKVFYSTGDVRTPMINASVALFINVILNFVLMNVMGLKGLAFATSISAYIAVIMLWKSLHRKINGLRLTSLFKVIVLCICNSILCIIFAYIFYEVMMSAVKREILSFMIAIVLYGIGYLLLSVFSGIIDKGALLKSLR